MTAPSPAVVGEEEQAFVARYVETRAEKLEALRALRALPKNAPAAFRMMALARVLQARLNHLQVICEIGAWGHAHPLVGEVFGGERR